MKGSPKPKKKLIEGEDFYYNERGFMVLTAKYHLENGRCCGNECVNCPYDHINVPGKGKGRREEERERREEEKERREEGKGQTANSSNPTTYNL